MPAIKKRTLVRSHSQRFSKFIWAAGICGLVAVQVLIQNMYAQSQEYNVYFGDFHSHTGYSDGAGTPAQAYEIAKNSGRGDFFSVTDHQRDDGTNGNWINPEEWELTLEAAAEYTDENFIAIAGHEMSHNPWGHINMFNHDVIRVTMSSLEHYYDEIMGSEEGAMTQWNHPASYSNLFEDFDHFSPELDAKMKMLEIGTGGGRPESAYPLALDAGFHIAPASNSDTHELNGLTGYDNRSAVLAMSLSEENIYNAINNLRVYATQDMNLKIIYRVNGQIMGSLLADPDSLNVSVTVEDPDESDAGDGISEILLVGEGGTTVLSNSFDSHSVEWNFTIVPENTYHYIRVEQADGDLAWTAPVWTSGGTPVKVGDRGGENLIRKLADVYDVKTLNYFIKENSYSIHTVSIYPTSGRLLRTLTVNSGKVPDFAPDLATGVYLVEVVGNTFRGQGRVVVW